ncbi:MAG: cryptochrome/photolyase family protein [Kineosporiaceae bacterium]
MGTSVMWFRRDLRLADHPALLAAVDAADGRSGEGGGRAGPDVVPLFVVDPALWEPAGPTRRAWLVRSLRSLDTALGGDVLVVRHGSPEDVVPQVARAAGASSVHVTADAGPYGRRRDERVAAALSDGDARFVRTGTPYAVGPGSVVNGSGEPYKVFTPFSRAWLRTGWPAPAAPAPSATVWRGASGRRRVDGEPLPPEPDLDGLRLPDVGEEAAHRRWHAFLDDGVAGYAGRRDRPDVDGTSAMSAHLKYGEIHPRTMLADLARLPSSARAGSDALRSELCWREFYADVLWHRPETARAYLRPELARMRYADPARSTTARDRLEAWQRGRTGYPFVDAGMRQLRAVGWVHNRVRMVVASFLVKDLHVEWQHGARWFMRWLRDGDLASNQHGWQWVAGSGTDAAPYFRVFNPVSQGEKFDPDGEYVRTYVPELAHLPGRTAHAPWDAPDGYAHGYPERIVDHAAERVEALARYAEIRNG